MNEAKQQRDIISSQEVPPDSNKEKTKKRVFLVFRDGGIRPFVDQVESSMSGLGHEVVTQTFPEGTSEEDIAKWAAENSSQFEGVEAITDDTFRRALGYKKADEFGLYKKATIDGLVDQATFRAVLGPDLGKSEEETNTDDLEKAEQIFKKMIGEVLKSEMNQPSVVVIFSEHMDDHSPFKNFREEAIKKASERVHERLAELFPDLDNSVLVLTDFDEAQYYKEHGKYSPAEKKLDKYKYFEEKGIPSSQWWDISDQIDEIERVDYEKDKKVGGIKPAEIIKRWLTELGLPEGIITISQDTEEMSLANPIFKHEGAWVVVDRHYDLGANSEFSGKVRRIGMPLGDLYGYLQKQKMLDVDPEKLNQILATIVEEKYGEK